MLRIQSSEANGEVVFTLSGQIHSGDCIRVSHEDGSATLMFGREPETVRAWGIAGRAAA